MLTFKEFISEKKQFQINMTHRDVHKHLTTHGWGLERNKGDHDVYGHADATHKIAVPRHKGDLAPGTVRQIMKSSTAFDKKQAA